MDGVGVSWMGWILVGVFGRKVRLFQSVVV
jgi:hypothetical protein